MKIKLTLLSLAFLGTTLCIHNLGQKSYASNLTNETSNFDDKSNKNETDSKSNLMKTLETLEKTNQNSDATTTVKTQINENENEQNSSLLQNNETSNSDDKSNKNETDSKSSLMKTLETLEKTNQNSDATTTIKTQINENKNEQNSSLLQKNENKNEIKFEGNSKSENKKTYSKETSFVQTKKQTEELKPETKEPHPNENEEIINKFLQQCNEFNVHFNALYREPNVTNKFNENMNRLNDYKFRLLQKAYKCDFLKPYINDISDPKKSMEDFQAYLTKANVGEQENNYKFKCFYYMALMEQMNERYEINYDFNNDPNFDELELRVKDDNLPDKHDGGFLREGFEKFKILNNGKYYCPQREYDELQREQTLLKDESIKKELESSKESAKSLSLNSLFCFKILKQCFEEDFKFNTNCRNINFSEFLNTDLNIQNNDLQLTNNCRELDCVVNNLEDSLNKICKNNLKKDVKSKVKQTTETDKMFGEFIKNLDHHMDDIRRYIELVNCLILFDFMLSDLDISGERDARVVLTNNFKRLHNSIYLAKKHLEKIQKIRTNIFSFQ